MVAHAAQETDFIICIQDNTNSERPEFLGDKSMLLWDFNMSDDQIHRKSMLKRTVGSASLVLHDTDDLIKVISALYLTGHNLQL